MNNTDYTNVFLENIKSYDNLGLNLKNNLETLLNESEINFMEIEYRTKTLESFENKIKRKNYKNPMEEIEDFCGVRIICYYINDLKKIDTLINENFNIISKVYKDAELEENKFGYRSNHYIVTLKDEWCSVPVLKNLKNLKAEIQVRTILMHAWADISHQLNYKQSSDKKFERKLNQLSALFEIADTHFVNLKEIKISQIKEVLEESKDYKSIEWDEDLLSQIIKKYIKRDESDNNNFLLSITVKSLSKYNISYKQLINYLTEIKEEDIKKLEFILADKKDKNFEVAQFGYLRLVLLLLNDDFFKNEPYYTRFKLDKTFIEMRKKYKQLLVNKE